MVRRLLLLLLLAAGMRISWNENSMSHSQSLRFGQYDHNGKALCGSGTYRVNGNLATTRAIGDTLEKPYISAVQRRTCFENEE